MRARNDKMSASQLQETPSHRIRRAKAKLENDNHAKNISSWKIRFCVIISFVIRSECSN